VRNLKTFIVTKRQVTIASLCLVFAASLLCASLFCQSAPTSEKPVPTSSKPCTNWGLNYNNGIGKPPTGNASASVLKAFNSYFIGDTNKKSVFLTFDAGYENGFTNSILDTLKQQKIKAAFFIVGHYVKTNPDLVRRMVEEGHIVGNHTCNHPDMSKISDFESFEKETLTLEELFKKATNKEMDKFYRPPCGKYSKNNLEHAQRSGFTTIFWSLAHKDWLVDNQPSEKEALEKLITRIHPGAIILLHSTSKTNTLILNNFISRIKDMGYNFESLHNLPK
jgi:peptidoglycan-N-acetylmuramic acid deacetylase